MSQSETVDRILDAAEVLFAEKGFSETSLRQITSKASVNLAAVNYHFGSKKELIQAVFSRFTNPFTYNLRESIEGALARKDAVGLDELLKIITSALVEVSARGDKSLSVFMRLLSLAYTQSQGHLRKYLEQQYSKEFRLFMKLMRKATPQLTKEERFWRMQFMLGAVAFTMSSPEALGSILQDKDGAVAPAEGIVEQIIPFLAAGISAPGTSSLDYSDAQVSQTASAVI